MILNIYALYDSKAMVYNRPFFFKNDAEAIRSFSDLCNDHECLPGRHPGDFALLQIGEYDEQTAEINPTKQRNIRNGRDVVHNPEETH